MAKNELTEKQYWEARWERVRLPVQAGPESRKTVTKRLLEIIDEYFPHESGIKILEIGGAPGPWLAYFGKAFGYDLHALDYSRIGCDKTKENLRLLGLSATVYCCDVMKDDLSNLPLFDIVYSLGFVEHFDDVDDAVGRHVGLLKEGGILMIGAPSFLGITRRVLQRTAPETLGRHNLLSMDMGTWRSFEAAYNLQPLYKGYIGGFDLMHCTRCEVRTPVNRAIRLGFKTLRRLINGMGVLGGCNSRYWSPYVVGIYRKG